jgi:hypothetical protein
MLNKSSMYLDLSEDSLLCLMLSKWIAVYFPLNYALLNSIRSRIESNLFQSCPLCVVMLAPCVVVKVTKNHLQDKYADKGLRYRANILDSRNCLRVK